jgi:DNA invertase Pin-like site-specific DNA recombinase
MKNVAIYARVSTTDKGQDVDLQLRDLRSYVESRGWQAYGEYVDNGISGSKDRRPMLDAMMSDAKKKRFDVVLVWRFDRFARSTKHLVTALEEFNHLGIDFISYQENIDTSSPMGKMIFTIASAFAEFELNLLKERVRAGLNNARAKGKRLGRPVMNLDAGKLSEMRSNGMTLRAIAQRFDCSPALVYKTLQISA